MVGFVIEVVMSRLRMLKLDEQFPEELEDLDMKTLLRPRPRRLFDEARARRRAQCGTVIS